jgi:hypothetical protein
MFGQMILMFLLDSPVPGTEMELFTPESLALSVSWKGPSLNDLVNDLIPCSVMLNPAIVLSKLIGDFLVIVGIHVVKNEFQFEILRVLINFGMVPSFESSTGTHLILDGFSE